MRLMARDLEMLRFLSDQGVATVDQLTDRYFPSRSACVSRIFELRQADLMESVPLTELKKMSVKAYQQAADLLGLKKEDLWKYRIYRLGARFRSRSIGAEAMSSVKMWKHQLQLNGVRKLCEDLFPNAIILTDPEIKIEWRRFGRQGDVLVPDLVIREQGRDVAIELERNRKGEDFYYQRFLEYRRSSYSHVIYFCESPSVFNKVAEMAASMPKIAVVMILKADVVFRKSFGFQPIAEYLENAP